MSGVPSSAGRADLSSPSRRPSISGGISTSGVSPRGARRLSLDLTAAATPATPSSVDEIRARLHDVMRSIDDTLLDAEASLFASSGSPSLRPPRRLSGAAATAALATSGVEAEEAYAVRHDPHHARAEREARRAELTALSRLPPTHPIASVSTGGSAGAVAGGVYKTGTPLPCSSSSRSPSPPSSSSSAASATSWQPHAQVLSHEAHERHAGRLGVSAAHRVDRLYSAEEAARVLSTAGESAAVVAGTGGSEDDAGDANSATTGMSDTYKATLDYWRADGHRSLHRFLKQGKLQSAHAKATRHSGGDAAVELHGEEQMPESMAKQSVPYRPRFASTASAVSATSTHTTASKYQKPTSARLGVPGGTATARGEGAAAGGGGAFSGVVGGGVGRVHYGGASNTVTDTLTSTCVSTHHSTSASSTASEERATVADANAQHREPPLSALESLRGAAPPASSSSSLPPPQLHTNTATAAAPVVGAPDETKRIAVSDGGPPPPPPRAADAVAASVPPAAITPSPAVALPSPASVPSLSARLAALRAADAAQRFPTPSWAVGRGAGGVDDSLAHAVSPPTTQCSDAYVPEAAEGLTFAATASAHVDPHTRSAAATTQREPGAACRRLDGLGSLPSPPRPQQPAPSLTRPRSGDDTTPSEVRPAAASPRLGTSRWREAPCGINASRLTDALVRSPDTSREASPNTKWTAGERRGRRDGRHEETAYVVELAQQRQAAAEEAWRQGQRGVDVDAPRRPRSLLAVSSLAEGSGVRLGVVGGAGGGPDGSASTSHDGFTRGGRGDPQHYPLLSTAPLDALQERLTALSVKEAEQRPRLTSTQSLRAHDERYDDDDGDGGAAVVMRQAAAFARRVDARDADASRHLEEEVAHHTAVQVDAQARVARVEAGVPVRERRAAAAALAEEVSAIRAHAAQLEKLRRHMRQEVDASSPPPLLPEKLPKDMKAASLPSPPPQQQQQKEHAAPHSRAVPERNAAHVFAGATDVTSATSSLNIPEVAPSPHRSRLGESSRTSPSRGQSESRPRRVVPLPPPLPEATAAASGAVTAMSAATALWSTAVEVEEEGYEDADGAAATAAVSARGRGGGGGRGEGASSDLSSVSATSLDDREAAGTPERATPSRLRMTERPEPKARAAAAAAVRRRDAAATQTEEPRSLMARDSAGAARSETVQRDGGPSPKKKGRKVAEDGAEDENTQQDWLTATQRPSGQIKSVASPMDTAVGEGDVGGPEKRTAEAQRTSATTAAAAEPPSPLPTNPASHQRFRPPPRRPAGDQAGNQRSATAVDGHVPPGGSRDELPSPRDRPSLSVEDAERDVVSSSPSAEPHRYASLSPERLAAIQSTQLHVSPTRDPAWRRGLEPSHHHHRHRHGNASARRGRASTSPSSSSSSLSSSRSSSTCEGRHTVALRSPIATSRHSTLANVQSQRPSLLGSGPPSQPPSPVPPPSRKSAEASAWRTAGQHHQHQHRSGEEMTEEQQREEEKEQQQRQQHQTSRQALNTATALKARAMLAEHGLHVTVQLAGHRLPAVVKLSEDGQELLFFLERVAEATSMATQYDTNDDAAADGSGSGSGGHVQEGRGATHGGTPRSRSAGASALSPRAAVSAPPAASSSSSSSCLMHGGQQSAQQPAVSPRGSPAGQRQPLGSRAPSSLLAHGAEPYRPLTSPNFQNPNTPHSTSALPLPTAVPVPQQAMAGSRSMSLYSVSPSVHLRHPPASVAAPTVVPAATAKPATPPPPQGFVKPPAGAVLHKVPPPHLSGGAAAPSVPPLRIPPPQLRATLLLQPPDASLTSPSPSSSLTPPPHPLPRHAPAASPRTASSSPAAPRLVRVRERHHFPCGNARLYVPYGVMGHERDAGMGGPETWEDVSSVLCGPASFEVLRRYGCPLFAHMRGKAYAPYRLFVIIPEFTRIDVPQDAVLLVLDFAQRVDWVLFLLAMQRSVADRTTRLELGERGRLTRERGGSRDAAAGRRAPPPVLSYGRALWMLAVQRLHRAQALRGLNPFESRVAARQTDGGASATPPRQRAVSLRDVQEARQRDPPHASTPSAAHAGSSRTASPQPAAGTQERRPQQQALRMQSAPLPLERVGSGLQGSRRRTATPAEATAAHLHRSPRDGRVHAAQLSGPAASGLPPGLRRVPQPHEQTAALAAHPTSSSSRGYQGGGPPAPALGSGNGGRSPPHPTGRVALTAQQQQQQQQYTSTIDLRNAQTVDQPSRGSENVHPMYAEETSKPRFRWLKHVASTLNSSRRNSVTAKTAVVPE